MGYTLTGFDGKVAVVTGAGRMRSIGRPIATALASAGCDVVLTGSGRAPRPSRRSVSRTSPLLVLALLALPRPAAAEERGADIAPPRREYHAWVASESEDEVAQLRFDAHGLQVVERIAVGIHRLGCGRDLLAGRDLPVGREIEGPDHRGRIADVHGGTNRIAAVAPVRRRHEDGDFVALAGALQLMRHRPDRRLAGDILGKTAICRS